MVVNDSVSYSTIALVQANVYHVYVKILVTKMEMDKFQVSVIHTFFDIIWTTIDHEKEICFFVFFFNFTKEPTLEYVSVIHLTPKNLKKKKVLYLKHSSTAVFQGDFG